MRVVAQSAACPVKIQSSPDMNHAICAKYSALALTRPGVLEQVIQAVDLTL